MGSRHRRISLACSELYRSIEMMTHADPKSEKLVGAVLSYRIALSAISPKELTRSERAVVALHLGRANGMMLDLGLARPAKAKTIRKRESGVLSKLSDPSVLKESIDSIREADGIVRKAKTLSELREAESIVRGLRCASKIDGGLEKRMISNIERKRKDISARILQVAQGQKRFPPKLPGEKIGRAEPVFEERKIRGLQESIARSLIRICGEAETLSGLREAEAMARGFHYDGRIDDAAAEKIISAIEAKRRTISSKITGNSS
ncbi:MAG: hypothetical protein NT067_00265 [Candidatus Diapherotrites archaeon]|nr:hypothetical protein [Candidatus Diapherotrites archaeon]